MELLSIENGPCPQDFRDWLDSLADPRWKDWIEQFEIQQQEPSNEIEFKDGKTNVYQFAYAGHSHKRERSEEAEEGELEEQELDRAIKKLQHGPLE